MTIRYIQVENLASPRKRAIDRHAEISPSWTQSRASASFRVTRRASV